MTPKQSEQAALRTYAATLTAIRRLHALGYPADVVAGLYVAAGQVAAERLEAAK